jgi:hypothetical protein
VDHSSNEYVPGDVTTSRAEGYFSQLKRSIHGTDHHVSAKHLARYLAEFDFRYSTRKESDTAYAAVAGPGGWQAAYVPATPGRSLSAR